MKDISTLIVELTEALDRNTAAVQGSRTVTTNGLTPEIEVVDAPKPKVAKNKPAVPKVDLVEIPQEEEEVVEKAPKQPNPLDKFVNATIDDLKAHAGSIHDPAVRATIKSFLKEECQCENLATAKETDYPKILQALVEAGATDTREA